MRITIVDDERRARQMMENVLRGLGETEIMSFSAAADALEYVRDKGCDLAFLDIEMPGMGGMDLADRFLELPEPPMIVFVTAYSEYALRAYDVEAVDYLLKPYGAGQVRRALERAGKRLRHAVRVEARCFPTFGLWVDGAPLDFGNKKAREFLAYLVHMQRNWVSMDSITFALFEDSGEKNAKSYYR